MKYYNALSLRTLFEKVLLTKTIIYIPENLSTLENQFIYTIDKINFGYSIKNIGIPQSKRYLLEKIEKMAMIIKRMS